MQHFLDYVIFDNPVRNILWVLAAIVFVLIFRKYISIVIAGLVFRFARQVARGIDKRSFVDLVSAPIQILLMISIIIIAFEKLRFPSVLDVNIYKVNLHTLIETLSIIVLISSIIWLCLRIIDFTAMILVKKANVDHTRGDNQLIVFFKDFFKIILVITGLLLILKFAFGFVISNLVTGLSIATAALALSFRESIENLIASFIIFFDKPFTSGDLVKVHHITGTVEKIGLRSTRIRTDQKTFAAVPNKQMVDTITDNLTLRTQRRVYVQLDLAAQTPAESVSQLIYGVESLLQRRKDKVENYTVFLSDISKNAFIIFIEYFTATIPIQDFNQLRQEVNLSIIELMEELNIKLAIREPEIPNQV